MAARLAQANLASKDDIADLVIGDKLNNLNKKLLQIKKIMYLLKMYLKNYRRLCLFISQSYFHNDGAQLYLIL